MWLLLFNYFEHFLIYRKKLFTYCWNYVCTWFSGRLCVCVCEFYCSVYTRRKDLMQFFTSCWCKICFTALLCSNGFKEFCFSYIFRLFNTQPSWWKGIMSRKTNFTQKLLNKVNKSYLFAWINGLNYLLPTNNYFSEIEGFVFDIALKVRTYGSFLS